MLKQGGPWFVVLALALAGCSLTRDGLGLSTQESPATAPDDEDTPDPEDDPEPAEPMGRPTAPDGSHRQEDAAAPPGPDASNGCDWTGAFALRIDADVSWAAPLVGGFASLVVPGSGTLTLYARVDASSGSARLAACGALIPEVATLTGEKLGGDFPNGGWDRVQARWDTALTAECDDPGCALRSELVEPRLGLALKPGVPWPGPLDVVDPSALLDDDADGVPGVQFVLRAPVGLGVFPGDRVTTLSMALRVVAELDGVVESCDVSSGTPSALSFDARVLACQLQGSSCRDDQVALFTRVFPTWQVQRATWRMVRLPAGDSCADVRAALR